MKVIKIISSVKADTTQIYVASGNVIQVTKSVAGGAPEDLVRVFESDHAEMMSHIIGFPDTKEVETFTAKYDDWTVEFELPKATIIGFPGGKQ